MTEHVYLVKELQPQGDIETHCYAPSVFLAAKAMKYLAEKRAMEIDPEHSQDRIFRFAEMKNVPHEGTFVFRGDENPCINKLNVKTRVPGWFYGFHETLASTFYLEAVPKWKDVNVYRATPATAPARIRGDSKEAATRDKLHDEVKQAVSPEDADISFKTKVLDGRDRFHNDLVGSVLEMRRRRRKNQKQ